MSTEQGNSKVLQTPWWMRTRVGQWLARRWRPAAVYWRACMEQALIQEAKREEEGARMLLLIRLNQVQADTELPPELLRAWIWWRNHAERVYQLECEATGTELPRLELDGYPLASEGWSSKN